MNEVHRIPPTRTLLALMVLLGTVVQAQVLSLDALRNASYGGIYHHPITLVDGSYAGPRDAPESAARPQATLLERLVARGDLDADGDEDAVVLLEESDGGTGRFLFVAAMVAVDGAPVNVATAWIGDRIPVRGLRIEEGRIVLDIVVEGPGDAACCKYSKAQQVLQLEDDTLVTFSFEERGRLSLADIEGVPWVLREIGTDQVPLSDVPITITFDGGRLVGSAGCNDYRATYASREASELPVDLEIGAVFATRRLCEPLVMAQEEEFLAKLGGLDSFGFWLGDLRFSYAVDGQFGTLLVERFRAPDDLTGGAWRWLRYEDPVVGSVAIADPAGFRLTFADSGRLSLATDCLSADLPYTAQGSGLIINPRGLDLAACSADSPTRRLVRDLEFVRLYALAQGRLLLDLYADGGTLLFERAE